jgi:hypothetical protein
MTPDMAKAKYSTMERVRPELSLATHSASGTHDGVVLPQWDHVPGLPEHDGLGIFWDTFSSFDLRR